MSKYSDQWKVLSSNGKMQYTVSKRTDDGSYECSCPAWTRRRVECRHIKRVKNGHIDENGRMISERERSESAMSSIAENALWRMA